MDVFANSVPPFATNKILFPNWVRTPAAAFTIMECDDVTCSWALNSPLVGLTIMNYGSASGGPGADITDLYFQLVCNGTNSGVLTMGYAGNWDVGGPVYPAWTWAGSIPWAGDPCEPPGGGSKGCSCMVGLYVYADIGPCPTDGATVALGPGYNLVNNPTWPGGIYDSVGCAAPWGVVAFDPATIRYLLVRADRDTAAPADTINYRIYYGRPGTGSLNTIWVMDSMPSFTHYAGGAVPAPDPGYDPDPGPPNRLRWTFAGPLATAGGQTGEIKFAATVDWGNGEMFEPGSGDVAAPENEFLLNAAHISWDGGGCPSGRVSGSASTVVRRFLFWMLGDNDILFAPRVGLADDEVIYEVFIKNMSGAKTWWDVSIWDTVPAQLDVWTPDYGFEDPCTGWTITPSGCAAASPGKRVAGSVTNLTWKLDMPPAMTLILRWKARVKGTTPAFVTARNVLSLLELGKTGIVGGTGHSGTIANFVHEAPIVLRITYTSYVGYAAWSNAGDNTPTYFISFYPLNKASDFQLYYKFCCGTMPPCDPACDLFRQDGGVSPKIDVFGGTCTGGPTTDWEMGCKAERSPARFIPSVWNGTFPGTPYNMLHKLVSNSPLIWEVSTALAGGNQDATTYAGTTNLTYCGYMAYAYCRVNTYPNVVDTLYTANTDSNLPTTLHIFTWNPLLLNWEYRTTADIFKESQWDWVPLTSNHYRLVSSQTRIIVQKGFPGLTIGGSYNDFGTAVPNRENGNLINDPSTIPATFYLWAAHTPGEDDTVIVGNVGAATATYRVYRYTPFDQTLPSPSINIPFTMVDKGGSWMYLGTDTVGPAMPVPGPTGSNPHAYGPTYDPSKFVSNYYFCKIQLTAGGPIQVVCGRNPYRESSGGSVMHPSDPAGKQVGQEFWFNDVTNTGIYSISLFCPKVNMGMRMASSDGYFAQYTTTDTDECISFQNITNPGGGIVRNYRIWVPAAGNPGDAIMQYHCGWSGEKFYSAPFMCKGVFYNIITPPVIYASQPFWITVVVMDSGGGTKTDYCGTSSFTSTDPTAQIQGSGMDAYNFIWSSAAACSSALDENGVKIFVGVIFNKLGLQTLVGSDTTDGAINGLATLMVVGVDVKLFKEPRLMIAASGDTVQFKVCWSNYSSASAFSFTITDAVPVGTTYVPETDTAMNCGSTDGVTMTVGYSLDPTTPATTWATASGMLPTGVRWLKWTVPIVGVQTTGCACFKITVD